MSYRPARKRIAPRSRKSHKGPFLPDHHLDQVTRLINETQNYSLSSEVVILIPIRRSSPPLPSIPYEAFLIFLLGGRLSTIIPEHDLPFACYSILATFLESSSPSSPPDYPKAPVRSNLRPSTTEGSFFPSFFFVLHTELIEVAVQ